MNLRSKDIKQILQKVPIQNRKEVEDILLGRIIKQVTCGKCGRIVAEITKQGEIIPKLDKLGKMWLLAYRHRLDGFLGFQCLCGNDSRLPVQEKGIKGIEENHVTQADINEALKRVRENPSEYPEENGLQNIDNFIVETL